MKMYPINTYKLGCWTFLFGSLSFSADAFSVKPRNHCLLLGCMMFNLGCLSFLADSYGIKGWKLIN